MRGPIARFMIQFINSYFRGRKSFTSSALEALTNTFSQIKNMRKGSRLSRMGLVLIKKIQVKFLAGLMIIGLSLGTFSQLTVFANRPVEAAEQIDSLILDEEISLTTHTESTAQLPIQEGQFRLTQTFSVFHPAVDLAASLGTPIKPIAAGQVVVMSSNNFGLGNYLVIKHGADLYSVYAHLNEFLVQKGDEVTKDTIIGTVGNTGFSTGPHLHLEIISDNQKINPLTVLPDF